MKKLKQKAVEFLREGLSPARVAAAVSLGIIVGIFPIYGPFSLLCIGLAFLFKLNLPLVLAGYYSMTFVKPVLIIPFVRFGEFIFRADPMSINLLELTRRFGENALATLQEFGWSFVHATVGWLVAVPFLVLLIFPVMLFMARSWQGRTSSREVLAVLMAVTVMGWPSSGFAWPFSSDGEPLFADTIDVEGETLSLIGTGVLRFKKIIPVYDAALYRGPSGAQRLEVVYRVNAKAKQFEEAGEKILAKNYTPAELEPFQDRLATINAWYPDPEKGDRCAITFVPGRGTELTFNGESKGRIEGDDFAALYFSIWLGEKPASIALRNQLLNQDA